MPELGWRSPGFCIAGGESEFGEQGRKNQNWDQAVRTEVVVRLLRSEREEMK